MNNRVIDGAVGRGRLQDIARLAGVGVATVDRVLNGRGNVSHSTAEKMLSVARQLNMRRAPAALPSSAAADRSVAAAAGTAVDRPDD